MAKPTAKLSRAPVRARKRTRAPAHRAMRPAAKPATAKHPITKPPSRNRYLFTPALLAYARRLFEETDTSLARIAIDLGIHRSTVPRLAEREGWVRQPRAPRDLPKAARLLAQADALEAATLDRHPEALAEGEPRRMHGPGLANASWQEPASGGRRPSRLDASRLAPQGDGESQVAAAQDDEERQARAGGGEEPDAPSEPITESVIAAGAPIIDSAAAPPEATHEAAAAANDLPPVAETLERLYRAVLDELTAVEAMRAQLKRHPRGAVEAERTARTLSSLTETFQKLQRLQLATTPAETDDDDMPADLDAFRLDLARRIDAFVASRTDPDDADGKAGAAAPVDQV